MARDAVWEGYVLSSWWRRVGAALVDAVVLFPFVFGLSLLFGVSVHDYFHASRGSLFLPNSTGLRNEAATILAALIYLPTIMKLTDGRTIGKYLTRIRVVRTDQKAMSFTRAAFREVIVKTLVFGGYPLSDLLLLPALDDLWPLWDKQNRALHDMLARTRVVRADLPVRESYS
jgi:uncharacterized RDD family membrane protein YckC